MVNVNPQGVESRQVLVNIGNRFVLFGSEAGLPADRAFTPQSVAEHPARIPDESLITEQRLVSSIRVAGAEIAPAPREAGTDLVFTEQTGRKVLVEVKIRERDANDGDFKRFQTQFREVPKGFSQEVWNFNVERLHLQIFLLENGKLKSVTDLNPLDVWEYNDDGTTFHRNLVIERVVDWENRVNGLYDTVAEWAKHVGLQTERTRKVLMSEELMQKFAVPDRELSVLDILQSGQTVASFVPLGLWIIGANGRINIVTHAGTHILIDRARELEKPEWVLISPENRRQFSPLDETAFSNLVRAV